LACVPIKSASGASETQAEVLAWQAASKLDGPMIRQASQPDSLDQECQRQVGDRQLGGHEAHRSATLLGRGLVGKFDLSVRRSPTTSGLCREPRLCSC